jgi:hypothetical protein
MFLVFRGNDLHSGFSPSNAALDDDTIGDIQQVYDSAVNRAFYVVFPNNAGSSRVSSMAISPPSHFGNQGAYVPHKVKSLNYSEHGQHILGTRDDAKNRLGRDFVRLLSNQLEVSGLRLNMPLNDLLKQITYETEEGREVSLKPQRFNIFDDEDTICTWRGYYQFHRQQCLDYLIHITKKEYNDVQKYLQNVATAERNASNTHFPTHRLPMAMISPLSGPKEPPELTISQVKNRALSDGKVTNSPLYSSSFMKNV